MEYKTIVYQSICCHEQYTVESRVIDVKPSHFVIMRYLEGAPGRHETLRVAMRESEGGIPVLEGLPGGMSRPRGPGVRGDPGA